MIMYGGELKMNVDDGHVYEMDGEYKSISKKYLDEIFSQRDEYQAMFEEYFQKYKGAQSSEEQKDAELKTVRSESAKKDAEIKRLKDKLIAKDKVFTGLKQETVVKDNEIARLKLKVADLERDNTELDRELNISEAKIERAYEKNMDEEGKVQLLSLKISKLENELKSLVTKNNILVYRTQGMDKALDEYKSDVKLKESAIMEMGKQIKTLISSSKKIEGDNVKMRNQNKDLQEMIVVLNRKLSESCERDIEMYDMIDKVSNGHKKCNSFLKKSSKKELILDKLKLLLEKRLANC